MGTRKEEVYVHWAVMEKEMTERAVGQIDEPMLLARWRRCAEIGETGVERSGPTDFICQLIGYVHSREGKTLERINQFSASQSAFEQSAEWSIKALDARYSAVRSISKNVIYKCLIVAYENLNDTESLIKRLRDWKNYSNQNADYQAERNRLLRKFPLLFGRI